MTYVDRLDVACVMCGATYTIGERHECHVVRPRLVEPSIDTFADLDAWLAKRIANVDADLGDDETMQSLGRDGQVRLTERRAELRNVRHVIASAVAAERDERATVAHEDAVEQQYRDRYGDEPLAVWQAEGR